jgi:hypothetical protein
MVSTVPVASGVDDVAHAELVLDQHEVPDRSP